MNTSVATDLYIDKAADFAKPILNHIRMLVHAADSRIQETTKWSMPFFDYKGSVCHMAAFKNHCALGFWKAGLMNDDFNIFKEKTEAMGRLGKITSLADLPADEILIAYIRQGIELNEKGVKAPAKPRITEKKELVIPEYFIAALQEDPQAFSIFQNFTPSNKKDYVLWLEEAKTETTRLKRLETAIEWIAEGKPRMWKYMKK